MAETKIPLNEQIIKEQVDGKTVYKNKHGETIETRELNFEDLITLNIGEVVELLRQNDQNNPDPGIVETISLRLLREASDLLVYAYYFIQKNIGNFRIVCSDDYYDKRSEETFLDVVFEPLKGAIQRPKRGQAHD